MSTRSTTRRARSDALRARAEALGMRLASYSVAYGSWPAWWLEWTPTAGPGLTWRYGPMPNLEVVREAMEHLERERRGEAAEVVGEEVVA